MPTAFDFQPDKELILTACTGSISTSEIIECVDAIRRDPRYRRELNGVCDVREGTLAFGAEDARAIAREIGAGENGSRGKWAFLIDEPRATALVLVFGSERGAKSPVRVFATARSASDWLDCHVGEQDLLKLRERATGAQQNP
jgi:hypothetical protein